MNTLLLSVKLILHLQMLTMHAILSVVNELQHQIQSCRPVMTWDSLGLHVLAPEVVGSEKTLKLQQDIGVADQQRHGNKVGIIA